MAETNDGNKAEEANERLVPKWDLTRAEIISRKLAEVAPDDDPAVVAGAIAIFATENIRRSAQVLPEARAYLNGMRDAIDGLLVNAFPPPEEKTAREIETDEE